MDKYLQSCYQLRRSMTHLRLYHLGQLYAINNQVGTCFQFLHAFNNLTHLYLSTNQIMLVMLIWTCFFVEHLTKFVSFTYHSDYRLPNPASNILVNPQNDFQTRRSVKLKNLDLKAPSFTESHIKCITTHTQLDTFNLNMTDENIQFDEWINGDDDSATSISTFQLHQKY